MREIKDNLYVFSVSPANYGEIIAFRNNGDDACKGIDVFSFMNASTNEKNFFFKSFAERGDRDIAIIGKRDGEKRVVIISRFFAYSTSLCLAVELTLSADDVAATLIRCAFDEILLSDEVKALGEADGGKNKNVTRVYRYIFEIERILSLLRTVRLNRKLLPPREICVAAMACADLVGVDMEYQIRNTFDDVSCVSVGNIFSGRMLVAVVLSLCIVAREYSVDRVLYFTVENKFNYILLSSAFALNGGTVPDTIEKLDQYVKSYGSIFGFYEHEGMLVCDLIPQYSDIGMLGLKQGEIFFDDVLWRDTF